MNTPCPPCHNVLRLPRAFAGCFLLIAVVGLGVRAAETASPPAVLELRSPDGRIVVTVNPTGALSYRLTVDGTPVLNDSRLGLRLRKVTRPGPIPWASGARCATVTRS
jgi:hypothetical protein